tara:strand:+ start:131 stop:1219 length:1089 start_codon:yes stop_codon:yes gene_type:complete
MTKSVFFGMPMLLILGCTKDIGEDNEATQGEGIICEQSDDGVFTATIDATDEESWVYLDLEACTAVVVDDPQSDVSWDIGFRRMNPKINGGVSGSGGMEAVIVYGADLDAVSSAPAAGYITDEADNNDDDVPEYAMADWYDYNIDTHILTPANQVYVLKTVNGDYAKVAFEDYYDDAGTSGFPQISYAFIDEPSEDDTGSDGADQPNPDDAVNCAAGTDLVTSTTDGDDTLTVIDSSSGSEWTCFSFTAAGQVDSDWDIAWRQYEAATSVSINGMVVTDVSYDALDSVPDGDWSEGDISLLEDWYVYSGPPDHVVNPAEQVYLLEDVNGTIWKMEISSYYKDGELGVDPHHPNIRWAALSDG